MKLVVGLGNPGEKYKNNRHNVGFRVVDELVKRNTANVTRGPDPQLVTCYMLPVAKTMLAKTSVFMNDSGRAVKKLVDFYKIHTNELYVVYDDLDIPLGKYKIQKGKGPRQHNGVESVDKALGIKRSLSLRDRQYWHVRVGIENRKVDEGREGRKSGEEYVLEDFGEDEEWILADVIKRIVTDIYVRL